MGDEIVILINAYHFNGCAIRFRTDATFVAKRSERNKLLPLVRG